MSSARKIPASYTQASPSKISILLATFGFGSYKLKSSQETQAIIDASKEDVQRSQVALAESEKVNEAALRVLARKN